MKERVIAEWPVLGLDLGASCATLALYTFFYVSIHVLYMMCISYTMWQLTLINIWLINRL